MGLRYRRSVNIGGVRVNLNKRGVSASVGGKGARYTVSSSGRRTTTVGVPGSGLRYQTQTSGGSRPRRPATRTGPVAVAPARPAKPGLFAPKAEKALFRALQQALADGQDDGWLTTMTDVAAGTPSLALAANTLAGLFAVTGHLGDPTPLLTAAYADGRDLAGDPFIRSYASNVQTSASFAGTAVVLPVSRELVGLLLCSLHQDTGDLDDALAVAEGLADSTLARLVRSDLLVELRRPAEALPLSEGTVNTDGVTVLLLASRAAALRALGRSDAAVEACREALRYPSRRAGPRHRARLERARAYLDLGQNAKARADVEKVLAEDSTADGLNELLNRVR